jgi:hypothetical protein
MLGANRKRGIRLFFIVDLCSFLSLYVSFPTICESCRGTPFKHVESSSSF